MAAYDDLNVKRIFVVGIASVVVTAVTALAVQVLYHAMAQWQKTETQAASNYTRQNSILQEQLQEVSVFGVDDTTGNIVIPVEKAIDLMVDEPSSRKRDSDSAADESEADSDPKADSDSKADSDPESDKENRDET